MLWLWIWCLFITLWITTHRSTRRDRGQQSRNEWLSQGGGRPLITWSQSRWPQVQEHRQNLPPPEGWADSLGVVLGRGSCWWTNPSWGCQGHGWGIQAGTLLALSQTSSHRFISRTMRRRAPESGQAQSEWSPHKRRGARKLSGLAGSLGWVLHPSSCLVCLWVRAPSLQCGVPHLCECGDDSMCMSLDIWMHIWFVLIIYELAMPNFKVSCFEN